MASVVADVACVESWPRFVSRLFLLCFSPLFLAVMHVPCCAQAIEAGSDLGETEIDKIVRKESYLGGFPTTESSPLSMALRAFLVERAKQGGVAALEAALSDAGASCRVLKLTHYCELRRFRILRSVDFLFPKYGKTSWIISISYEPRGDVIQNIHVNYTSSYKLTE